jgi:hypothetical protein
MRRRAPRLAVAAAVALAAVALLAAAAPAPAVTSSGWAPAGSITDTDQVTFAGEGIAIAAGGAGTLVWQNAPDLMTDRLAQFALRQPPKPVALAAPLVGASQAAAVADGFAIGALDEQHVFQVRFGAGGTPMTPGLAQHLVSYPAVIGAGDGEVAVLGASGAQPVLTICRPTGCGRTIALASSRGTLSTDGAEAQGSGLAVAVSPAGAIVAAWILNGQVQARTRSAAGRLGPTQTLARVQPQVWMAAAMSVGGRAALVWESQNDRRIARPGPALSATLAAAALAPPGGRFATPIRLGFFAASPSTLGPTDVTLSAPPVVAVAFNGALPLALWTGHSASGFVIESSNLERPAQAPQTVSPPHQSATLGDLSSAPGKGLLATWLACTFNFQHVCYPWALQAAPAAPGEVFAPSVQIAPGPFDATFFSAGAVGAIDPASGDVYAAAVNNQTLTLFSRGPW